MNAPGSLHSQYNIEMKNQGLPQKQGLYDPQFEHDACGVGFIVHMKGSKSHDIVQNALTILVNLDHRGACGCEKNSGDGAGILMQIPHKFLAKVAGFPLPEAGQYGVGSLYGSPDAATRKKGREIFEQIAKSEGHTVLGWRDVPTDNSSLGNTAQASEPFLQQVFIQRPTGIADDLSFERKLYILRKMAHRAIRTAGVDPFWYAPSLSCRTLVYKGMLMPEQVGEVFPDLARHRHGECARAGAFPLFDEHLPELGTVASVSLHRPQRRNQHAARQYQLDARARVAVRQSDLFGDDIKKILPIINADGCDSAMFDNCLELLVTGRTLAAARDDDDDSRAVGRS